MFNQHWFFDSVPTKDLGITEKDIKSNKEEYYVIGGVQGSLTNLVELYNNLGLKRNTKGRKFVKKDDNLVLANKEFTDYISSRKIAIYGTVFYHSQMPEFIKNNPDLYVAQDNPNEKGIGGLRGRAFAQTIWGIMEPLKAVPEVNPVVCLDNEDQAICECVEYHFYNQLKEKKPDAKVKIQSINLAEQNEPKGYVLCDIVASLIGNYINDPTNFQLIYGLLTHTIRLDSKLRLNSFDDNKFEAKYETGQVNAWQIGGKAL